MKDSITADEKKLLDYAIEKVYDVLSYCHRNGINLAVSMMAEPDYKGIDKVYDYAEVNAYEIYPSGKPKRAVTLRFNPYTNEAQYSESLFEDKDNE